jgi:hypothetical protein
MPLPVIADTYRVSLEWLNSNGQHATNVMHIHGAGQTALDVLNQYDSLVTADMWDCVSSSGQVVELRCIKLDGTSDGRWQGNASGQPIAQACGMVKMITGVRGRSNRGRLYLPWVAEDVQSGGFISSAVVATMQTAWDAWLAAMPGTLGSTAVASYRHANQHPVTAIVVESPTGTQRRRQQRNR